MTFAKADLWSTTLIFRAKRQLGTTALIGIAFLLFLSAAGEAAKPQRVIPRVTAADFRPVYRLAKVGKIGPILSGPQMRWVQTVKASNYWKHRLNHLWFSPEDFEQIPLIIFYAPDYTLRTGNDHTGGKPNGDAVYQIVGNGCAGGFSRYKGVDSVIGPAPNGGRTTWPADCYYDPLAKDQREKNMQPEVPPAAPAD